MLVGCGWKVMKIDTDIGKWPKNYEPINFQQIFTHNMAKAYKHTRVGTLNIDMEMNTEYL